MISPLSVSRSQSFRQPVEAVFSVIADVEKYPEFVPGVMTATLMPASSSSLHSFQAVLDMGYWLVREPYRCIVHLNPHESIDIEYVEGPFDHLENRWQFQPQGDGTRVDFTISFAFRNAFLQRMAEGMLSKIISEMMKAFVKRINVLFPDPSISYE